MDVCEGDTSTGSRNPSPSLPEGASTSTNEETPMEQGPSALPDGKATSEPSTSSSHSSENGDSSGSVFETAGSSESYEKSGENDSVVGDESSGLSDSVNGSEAVLTDTMLKEEQRLHDAESRENSTEREKVFLPSFPPSSHFSFPASCDISYMYVPHAATLSHPSVTHFTHIHDLS